MDWSPSDYSYHLLSYIESVDWCDFTPFPRKIEVALIFWYFYFRLCFYGVFTQTTWAIISGWRWMNLSLTSLSNSFTLGNTIYGQCHLSQNSIAITPWLANAIRISSINSSLSTFNFFLGFNRGLVFLLQLKNKSTQLNCVIFWSYRCQ